MLTVKQIIREGKRFAVMCGGGTLAFLDAAALEQSGLEPGSDIEEHELGEFARQSAYRFARERALYAIGHKEYCREGLIRMLTRDDCPRSVAERVADEMTRLRLLDDERYAAMLAAYLYGDKHFGRRRVMIEMTAKGLDREIAERAADKEQPDPAEALDQLLGTRIGRELDTPTGVRRAMGNLMRHGYETTDIRAAIARRNGK